MAEKKKITRKVISKASAAIVPQKEEDVVGQTEEVVKQTEKTRKTCVFCKGKTNPSYTDIATLRRFITDRAKIVAKAKSSLCSRHQRVISKQIKYARHLSLLPFTPKV